MKDFFNLGFEIFKVVCKSAVLILAFVGFITLVWRVLH